MTRNRSKRLNNCLSKVWHMKLVTVTIAIIDHHVVQPLAVADGFRHSHGCTDTVRVQSTSANREAPKLDQNIILQFGSATKIWR